MAEPSKWAPSDVLEPIKRFLEGDLPMTPSTKVEQYLDGDTLVVRAEVPGIDPD
jgi:HSP20 family protein